MNDAMSSINQSRDRLSEDFRALATHAEDLMRATASVSGEGMALVRQNLTESLANARAQLNRIQSYALERSKQAVTATDTYVHQKPWQAVAIAAVAGLFLGLFSLGRVRRH